MKTRHILLLRHAKSAWDDPELDDYERPLAPRGRRAAAVMGVYLRDEGLVPDQVLCSAAARGRETWAGAARALAPPPPVEYDPALYMAPPERLLRRLRKLPDTVGSVLLVGHEGGVDALARRLTGRGEAALRRKLAEKFPTAALAVIAVEADHWRDLAEGAGTIVGLVAPKELV
jgi:phosphohistidine phosphatase